MVNPAADYRTLPDCPAIFVFFHGRHENERELGGHTTYGCVVTGEGSLLERRGYLGKSAVSSWSRGIPEFKGIRVLINMLKAYGMPPSTIIHVLLDDQFVAQQLCLKTPASEIAGPHLERLLNALKSLKWALRVIPCTPDRPEMKRAKELSLEAMRHYVPYAGTTQGG